MSQSRTLQQSPQCNAEANDLKFNKAANNKRINCFDVMHSSKDECTNQSTASESSWFDLIWTTNQWVFRSKIKWPCEWRSVDELERIYTLPLFSFFWCNQCNYTGNDETKDKIYWINVLSDLHLIFKAAL